MSKTMKVTARSGDDHVIGADGQLVNLDAARREAARKDAEKAAAAEAAAKSPADPLDHDGDGRKGGMKGVAPQAPAAAKDEA